jgi:hypothetical protein
VDPVGEDREEALHDPVPVFGVDRLGEIHRPLHVGEEDGHLLALAFEGAARREDLLGEVLRSVGSRIRGCGTVGRTSQRPAAAVAELLLCRIRLSAGRATQRAGQRRSAFTAETRISRIFEAASYAPHRGPLGRPERRDRRPGGQLHARDSDRRSVRSSFGRAHSASSEDPPHRRLRHVDRLRHRASKRTAPGVIVSHESMSRTVSCAIDHLFEA